MIIDDAHLPFTAPAPEARDQAQVVGRSPKKVEVKPSGGGRTDWNVARIMRGTLSLDMDKVPLGVAPDEDEQTTKIWIFSFLNWLCHV